MEATDTRYRFLVFGIPKLVNYLRILGFDTIYMRKDYQKAIQIAREENRILISQVNSLPKLPWILYLTHKKNDLRLKEIFQKLKITLKEEDIYTRCGACNTPLSVISKEEIKEILPPDLKSCNYLFKRCPNCGKIYWKGEHFLTLKNKLLKLGIMTENSYRVFNHTADLGIEVGAYSEEDLFVKMGKALFSELIEGDIFPQEEVFTLKLSDPFREGLLVKFINELIYRFEVDGVVCADFVCKLSKDELFCNCYGEKFNPEKHIQKREIKAATYHDIFFGKEGKKWIARVILDI